MPRDRDLSRSPSYRRRYSRSPSPVGHKYSRRSRRDRSRSPYSYSRRRSRSKSPRRRKNRSPTPRRRKSRSPTPRRHKRQKSRSISLSPISKSPSLGSIERKSASEKLRKEEEEKKSPSMHQTGLSVTLDANGVETSSKCNTTSGKLGLEFDRRRRLVA